MKTLILTLVVLLSSSSFASSLFIQNDDFICSDGKNTVCSEVISEVGGQGDGGLKAFAMKTS